MEESGENWPSHHSNLQVDEESGGDPMIRSEIDRQRELNETLLALSATVPAFNKVDDTCSMVDKASNYVKQLEERVRELEQQVNQSYGCDEVNSNDHYGRSNYQNLPEVKARVLHKQVLVTIHCEKQEDIILKISSHLQNLHLSLLNSSVLRFGKSNLNIKIVAQMGEGYNMTVDELVRSLREAIWAQ